MASIARYEGEVAAEAVRTWLERQHFGSLTPVAVELRRGEDSSRRPAWYFEVTLPDPDPREGTWPVDDVIAMDLATRDEALDQGVPWPWYVRIHPETHEQLADDDPADADESEAGRV